MYLVTFGKNIWLYDITDYLISNNISLEQFCNYTVSKKHQSFFKTRQEALNAINIFTSYYNRKEYLPNRNSKILRPTEFSIIPCYNKFYYTYS